MEKLVMTEWYDEVTNKVFKFKGKTKEECFKKLDEFWMEESYYETLFDDYLDQDEFFEEVCQEILTTGEFRIGRGYTNIIIKFA